MAKRAAFAARSAFYGLGGGIVATIVPAHLAILAICLDFLAQFDELI
jgi:hypothetical protein